MALIILEIYKLFNSLGSALSWGLKPKLMLVLGKANILHRHSAYKTRAL